jgi:hypothetical protein
MEGRTVHTVESDRPQMALEPPVLHLEKQTIRVSTDRLHGRDRPHSRRGPSGKFWATKSTGQNGLKHEHTRTHEEHDEHQICRLLMDCLPGTETTTRAQPSKGQLLLPISRSPELTKGLLPNHRCRWSASRRWYTYKFVAPNPLNREESRSYRAHTKC